MAAEIDRKANAVKESIDALGCVNCSLTDYLDALKDIRTHLDICIDASEGDFKTRNGEG